MAIEATHFGVSSTRASESIMRSMHGLACSLTMSLIHSLLHFSQTVFFFRSIRAARHSLTCGLGKICSLKYDLPWNRGSLHIQASHKCSPLSAGLGQNAHFTGIGGFYADALGYSSILSPIGGGSEVLHPTNLDCTKIVQKMPISACGNGLSHLLDLCSNGARKC